MTTPVKPDIPVGTLTLTWWNNPADLGHRLQVTHADPRVGVTDELVYDMLMAKAAAVRWGVTPNCAVDWTEQGLVMTIRCGVTGERYVYRQDPPERQAYAPGEHCTSWTAVD